jgi:hypothetical protein
MLRLLFVLSLTFSFQNVFAQASTFDAFLMRFVPYLNSADDVCDLSQKEVRLFNEKIEGKINYSIGFIHCEKVDARNVMIHLRTIGRNCSQSANFTRIRTDIELSSDILNSLGIHQDAGLWCHSRNAHPEDCERRVYQFVPYCH